MKKTQADNLRGSLPTFMNNLGGYLKGLVSLQQNKDLIVNASGSIGFLIQLFGKPLMDGYFEKVKQKKLKEFGFDTYAFAAFNQTTKSLSSLKEFIAQDIPLNESIIGLEKDFIQHVLEVEKKLTVSVFQPKYHPAVQFVKAVVLNVLQKFDLDDSLLNHFRKEFNDGIEGAVEDAFGEYYIEHKDSIKKLLFHENETKLLLDIIENSRIGFVENEDLKYEEAYGKWLPISSKVSFQEYHNEEEILSFERSLKKVEVLIEEYFSVNPENYIDSILFIIADFGKGKSVFLKRYAAEIAKRYLESGEGYIPVYFNLRSFANYSSDTSLGIIEDYLLTEYGLKISSEYSKKKKYIFLIDSLDESCDLSKNAVEKVLNSVRRIQNIDKSEVRTNRLVIASRPFDDVLFNNINLCKPHQIRTEKGGKEIGHFLALYGFKKEQFNDWIYNTLKSIKNNIEIKGQTGFAFDVINAVNQSNSPDIFSILFGNSILSPAELRRPIFAYMIYQLILNNINITQVGKIGIYLSFLNLLTKEAKYINDPNLKINLQEQFEARNILHHVAALWLFEKQRGRQGSLKKADLCRIIGNYRDIENDHIVLEKYKADGLSDIEFLSHSYFGENNSVLHFQHQSFAEVLLAEYYLKLFIKSSMDEVVNFDFVITMLNVGNPTTQTIEFLIELLRLLKATVKDHQSQDQFEKRKLLTPLLASIALHTNNKRLYSPRLFYQWYQPANINKETTEIPNSLLEKWCIKEENLELLISLCEKIINSDDVYLLSKSSSYTSLIQDEVTKVLNVDYKSTLRIEKYISLIVGTTISDTSNSVFIQKFDSVFMAELLREANQVWVKKCFKFMRLSNDASYAHIWGIGFESLHLEGFDFSNSYIENVIFFNCVLTGNSFKNAKFKNVRFYGCNLSDNNFNNVEIEGLLDLSTSIIGDYGPLPTTLQIRPFRRALSKLNTQQKEAYFYYSNRISRIITYIRFTSLSAIDVYFYQIKFYLVYCFQNKYLSKEEVLKIFSSRKSKFRERINQIINEIYETGSFKLQESLHTQLVEYEQFLNV
jgi:hypothetical protein